MCIRLTVNLQEINILNSIFCFFLKDLLDIYWGIKWLLQHIMIKKNINDCLVPVHCHLPLHCPPHWGFLCELRAFCLPWPWVYSWWHLSSNQLWIWSIWLLPSCVLVRFFVFGRVLCIFYWHLIIYEFNWVVVNFVVLGCCFLLLK